jgi:hypothetical protein
MPGLLQYKSEIPDKSDAPPTCTEHPEDVSLWLPSQLCPEDRQQVRMPDLAAIEEKLRTAQCHDALESVRHILKIKSRLIKFKHKNVRGQKEGLRSRAIIDRVHERARAAAAKYRAARVAKLVLSGPGGWEDELRVLADADIRAYQDPKQLLRKRGRQGTIEDDHLSGNLEAGDFEEASETEDFSLLREKRSQRDGTGETRRTLSWIWLTGNVAANQEDEGDEILQVEWAKSRARAARAVEEVLLLREEMRRVIEFLKWKSEWWVSRAEHQSEDKGMAEGLHAYAHKQASLQNSLSQHFQLVWKTPLEDLSVDGSIVDGVDDDDSDGEEAIVD